MNSRSASGDAGGAEHLEEALHQGDALGAVGIARLVEDAPEDRHGHAPAGNAEGEEAGPRPMPGQMFGKDGLEFWTGSCGRSAIRRKRRVA